MRILFLDLDTLRPDHLGCYGYRRDTSPNIDRIAAGGTRFDNYYCSDAPCLPSRAALISGQFGIHSGVVGHGGTAADMRIVGAERGFRDILGTGQALPMRIMITALLIAPLGFFMGMPFPKGTLRVGELVDWGFAVNGAASVLGATIIVLVGITYGLTVALLFGAVLYFVAYLLISMKVGWR